MTKSEFTDVFARRAGVSTQTAERLLAAILDSLEDALFRDGKVVLRGIGSFETKMSGPRTAINPFTKEELTIPASKTVRFRPAGQLKQMLN